MNHKENSILFWDQFFKDRTPIVIDPKDIVITTKLDQYLKQVGDQSENVLDIGCGVGFCLIASKILGNKIKMGIGFDTSKNAIYFANETVKLSKIEGLTFHVSDETYLNEIPDESFDGIICSNFLDVIPKVLSDIIIKDIIRILKPNGLFLLKINFPLTDELIEKMKMEKLEENTYQMNGVIRAYDLPTEQWIQRFKDLDVLAIDGFRRAEHLPEDRIILFTKK